MDAQAALKIISIISQGLALGEKLLPLLDRVRDMVKNFEDPNRPDVTIEVFDAELEAMRQRSARIQDTSNDPPAT